MLIELKRLSLRATGWFLHPRRLAEPMQALIDRLIPAVNAQRERITPARAMRLRSRLGWTPACPMRWHAAWPRPMDSSIRWTSPKSPTQRGNRWPKWPSCTTRWRQSSGLQRLQQQIDALPAGSYWENLAKIALGDDLSALLRFITLEVLNKSQGNVADMLSAWEAENRSELEGAGRLVAELADAKSPDLAMLSVAMRKLRNLA